MSTEEFILARERNPYAAVGLATGHLMRHPAFANAPFGHIARIIAGQVNREDYFFIMKGRSLIGFIGWARTDRATAEAWLAGRPVTDADVARDPSEGDVILLNMLQADDPAVMRFLLRALPGEFAGAEMIVAKRRYADGRERVVRLPVSHRAHPLPKDRKVRPPRQTAGAPLTV